MTNLQGNVQQLEGRINSQILGVKGLKVKFYISCCSKYCHCSLKKGNTTFPWISIWALIWNFSLKEGVLIRRRVLNQGGSLLSLLSSRTKIKRRDNTLKGTLKVHGDISNWNRKETIVMYWLNIKRCVSQVNLFLSSTFPSPPQQLIQGLLSLLI